METIDDIPVYPGEIPLCSSNEGCKLINDLLQKDFTTREGYFLYKRDMEREILYNEERIFQLNDEIQDLLQANRNGRTLIEGMLNDILNHGNKE